MIKEIEISILDADTDIIVHQANCFHTMGSGIARTLREKFPECYEADVQQTKSGDSKKLGTISVAKIKDPSSRIKYIFNMYSQFTFGTANRQTHYEAFYRGLEAVRGKVANTKLTIAFPFKIGCKLGGGSWRVVRE